jgi:hypothetical protein
LRERESISLIGLASATSGQSTSITPSLSQPSIANVKSPEENATPSSGPSQARIPLSTIPGPSQKPQTLTSTPPRHVFVLLCVRRGLKLRHAQIDTTLCANDDAFFKELRKEYRRLRGFWRYWFDPRQFAYCHFSKFTRYYVNSVAKVRNELPVVNEYEYVPRPPDVPYYPPIPPEEWYDRFYDLINTQGLKEALARIPRRHKRFQLATHVSGREDMWGLHVEFSPSLVIVVLWQIAISAAGWVFLTWWLTKHNGDWQNAGVPVTLILTSLVVFWSPLSGRFRDPVPRAD